MLNENAISFYVELDTLLDTKLGVLRSQFEKTAKNIYTDKGSMRLYTHRIHDNFGRIYEDPNYVHQDFVDAFSNRDVSTLKHSYLTCMIKPLKEELEHCKDETRGSPWKNTLQFHVNYWPYKLSSRAIKSIELALFSMLKVENLKLVSYPPELTSLAFLKSQYTIAFIRSHNDWDKIHQEHNKRNGDPTFRIIAPALLLPDFDEEALRSWCRDMNEESPFTAIEMGCATLYGLELLGASSFSINNELYQKKVHRT